jgi:hypothetical protein
LNHRTHPKARPSGLISPIIAAIALLILILSSGAPGLAQSQTQLWIEYQLSYPFRNVFLLENTTTYQTLLTKEGKWNCIALSPTFEYTAFRWLDLLSEVPVGYTHQTETASTFEVTPMVGGRFHITHTRRIKPRLVCRYQVRAFREIEAAEWEISNRTRLRGEILVTINGPSLFVDNLWHAFADYEEFIVLDQQLDERYANRRRARAGLGYRLNYKHRFELSYTLQASRDEIDGGFEQNDNVIQFKYKMFLNPATPGASGGILR